MSADNRLARLHEEFRDGFIGAGMPSDQADAAASAAAPNFVEVANQMPPGSLEVQFRADGAYKVRAKQSDNG